MWESFHNAYIYHTVTLYMLHILQFCWLYINQAGGKASLKQTNYKSYRWSIKGNSARRREFCLQGLPCSAPRQEDIMSCVTQDVLAVATACHSHSQEPFTLSKCSHVNPNYMAGQKSNGLMTSLFIKLLMMKLLYFLIFKRPNH